jgi:hypothetical protein
LSKRQQQEDSVIERKDMPDVNGITLAKAIRAIDDKMWQLQEQMKGIDPDEDEYDQLDMEYLGYMKAAHALRDAYEEACETTTNLLSYGNLVREA